MRKLFVFTLATGLAISGAAAAGKPAVESAQFDPANFPAQREAIIKGLRGKTYAELSAEDREAVVAALSRIEDRLEGISRIEDMDKRDQTALFNDQELVNNLLTEAAADSRLICRREKFVGSHRTTNICLTVAERRRLAQAAQDQMYGLQGSGYLEPERRVPPTPFARRPGREP